MPETQHLHWGAEALWERLEPLLPGLSVEVMARVDSTNTRLLDRARELSGERDGPVTRPGELDALTAERSTPHGRRGADVQPCLLVAEQQTLGRGRMGRGWQSSAGASLTFSLALPLAPPDWSGLSLAVGLALAEALDPLQGDSPPRLQLKWPNDLWLREGPGRGRKLGGILIETVSVGRRRMCVVGVGLNVLPRPAPALPELAHGYACVQELDSAATAPAVLARVAEPLARALLRFQAEGFRPLVQAYARRDLLRGQAVTTTLAEVPGGVADGVDERGALCVRSGALHHLVSGEVSVRLQHGNAA
jgi:BirA family transcriptional regulator, biotin operon repressor / biotin---[acetyl-CoA-carboxylase] ligase